MTIAKPSTSSKAFATPIISTLKGARYLGILAMLLVVGWYGHQTHWSFRPGAHASESDHSSAGGGAEHSALKPAEADEPAVVGEWKVTFPNEQSLALAGIGMAPVEKKSISERVQATGVITYDERLSASLSARTTGTVWRVCKHIGETVHKGDVLVIVDAAEVGQSKAEFLSALVAREAKTEILSNLESVGNGAIPQRQVREAKVALRETRIRLLNSEQTLVNLGYALKADDFQELGDVERAERIQFLGLPESMTQELDRGKTTSNLLPIRATFDGVVLSQDVALGETVEVGKPILEIADIRRMWLKLDVPKEDASKLALGQLVSFNADGIEHELRGSIAWISTEMNEQTRTLQVRAEVENPVVSSDPKSGQEVRMLRANTFGKGTIVLRDSPGALVIPISAVLHDNRQPLVFARTSGLTFERFDVELGIRDGAHVQIRGEALQPGMEVVSQGGHLLKSEWTLNHVASVSP